MALSASTPPDSMNEICHRLQMKDVFDVSTATLRTNLRYSVIFRDGKFLSGIEILHKFLGKYRGKKGLVFCRTINDCKEVAASLQRECCIGSDTVYLTNRLGKSWKANQYHAGLRDNKEWFVLMACCTSEDPLIPCFLQSEAVHTIPWRPRYPGYNSKQCT